MTGIPSVLLALTGAVNTPVVGVFDASNTYGQLLIMLAASGAAVGNPTATISDADTGQEISSWLVGPTAQAAFVVLDDDEGIAGRFTPGGPSLNTLRYPYRVKRIAYNIPALGAGIAGTIWVVGRVPGT